MAIDHVFSLLTAHVAKPEPIVRHLSQFIYKPRHRLLNAVVEILLLDPDMRLFIGRRILSRPTDMIILRHLHVLLFQIDFWAECAI